MLLCLNKGLKKNVKVKYFALVNKIPFLTVTHSVTVKASALEQLIASLRGDQAFIVIYWGIKYWDA